jgi:hypothetical protein
MGYAVPEGTFDAQKKSKTSGLNQHREKEMAKGRKVGKPQSQRVRTGPLHASGKPWTPKKGKIQRL